MSDNLFTKVPRGWVEIDREPAFKVGDKVKLHTMELWSVKVYTGRVTMVGIFDTELAGAFPINPGYPPLVYGYSIKVEKADGIYIYPGVPEFHVEPASKKKVKTKG